MTVNLEPLRDELCDRYNNQGQSAEHLAEWLHSEHHIRTSRQSIIRRLRSWGVPIKKTMKQNVAIDEQLRVLVTEEFYRNNCDETQLLLVLRQAGYDFSSRTLKRVRYNLGCYRRKSNERWEAHRAELEARSRRESHLRSAQSEYQTRLQMS